MIVVAEDSCHPTDKCTPQHVRSLTSEHGDMWLGGLNRPKNYTHIFKNKTFTVRAQAGCKLFAGSRRFWRIASDVMNRLSKDQCVDGLFQTLVGVRCLRLQEPALAGSMIHISARCGLASVKAGTIRVDGALLDMKNLPKPVSDETTTFVKRRWDWTTKRGLPMSKIGPAE